MSGITSVLTSIDHCLDLLSDFKDVTEDESKADADNDELANDTVTTTSKHNAQQTGKNKKVLVSGCFDLLHSGHVEFFRQAAEHGDLYVRLGTDKNIEKLKHHKTLFDENERLFMVDNLKSVFNAQLSQGSGVFDFETDMDILNPDIYFVNQDASQLEERVKICQSRNIEMIVKKRQPNEEHGLKVRSSTDIKAKLLKSIVNSNNSSNKNKNKNENETKENLNENENVNLNLNIHSNHIQIKNDLKNINLYNDVFPWRLCFAGGWLDLAWCNRWYPGCVITINVKYHPQFQDYCGLATSSRKHAIKLWNGQLPTHLEAINAAQYLWGSENFDHFGNLTKSYIAGSQDHCGLFFPGINKLEYNINKKHKTGCHWPDNIINLNNNTNDEKQIKIFKWLESVLYIIKSPNYFGRQNVKKYDSQKINHLKDDNIDVKEKERMVKNLSDASELAWQGIINMDIDKLGKGLSDTMKAWEEMLPYTVNPCDSKEDNAKMKEYWKQYDIPRTKGCLFSGAGGGFIFVINDKPVDGAFQIKINHDHYCKPFPSNRI